MDRKKTFSILLVACFLASAGSGQESLGTRFTYQGQLQQSGEPVDGSFDFRFTLHDAPAPGGDTELGTSTRCAVDVSEGLFTVELDFGASFLGDASWLETEVAPAGPCDNTTTYTTLSPLQRLNASPNALFARDAGTLEGRGAADFLPSGEPLGQLEVSGDLVLTGAGGQIVFGDGTTQDTASGASPPAVTTPSIFVPAALLCGDAPESDPLVWGSLASGTFRLSLDGATQDVGVNFAGVAGTMPAVAERIQSALRAVTGGQETVLWVVDHFEIRSADTISTSSIGPLEPTGIPIDISGSGGDNWLDCDTGNALVIDAVLDASAYPGHVALLDSNSQLDRFFVPETEVDVVLDVSRLFTRTDDGPGEYLIEVPIDFERPNTFEITGFMALFFDPQGNGDTFNSATRFVIQGSFVGDLLIFFKKLEDNRNTPALDQIDLDWPFSNRSTSLDAMSLAVASDRIRARVLGIERKEASIRVALSVEEDSINPGDRWSLSFRLNSVYVER